MSLEEAYDLPAGFNLQRADDMQRVDAADGTRLCVLVSRSTGERQLVHEDVVEYDGGLDHPAVSGLAGFLGLLAVLLVPTVAGYIGGAALGGSIYTAAGGGFICALVGTVGANLCLDRTALGDWMWRFLEWNDVKHIVSARGETA